MCNYCGSWTGIVVPKQREKPAVAQPKKSSFGTFTIVLGLLLFVTGITLVIVGITTSASNALIWVGGLLAALALIVPTILFGVYCAGKAMKGVGSQVGSQLGKISSDIGTSIKNISSTASTALGDFFNRFGVGSFTSRLSKDKFDSITFGTSLEHVEALFGNGKQTYAGKSGLSEIKVIIWQENTLPGQNRKVVTIKFQDNQVVEKNQFGL